MNKNKNISARVTTQEYNEIKKNASKASMKLSDYIVHSCLAINNTSNTYEKDVLLDIQKLVNKYHSSVIKKKDFIKKLEGILNNHGIF